VVWDRRRFEAFWGSAYRFESSAPAAQRVRGHCALPLLWRGQGIGWGNLARSGRRLAGDIGHVSGSAPRDRGYRLALEAELDRMRAFLAGGAADAINPGSPAPAAPPAPPGQSPRRALPG